MLTGIGKSHLAAIFIGQALVKGQAVMLETADSQFRDYCWYEPQGMPTGSWFLCVASAPTQLAATLRAGHVRTFTLLPVPIGALMLPDADKWCDYTDGQHRVYVGRTRVAACLKLGNPSEKPRLYVVLGGAPGTSWFSHLPLLAWMYPELALVVCRCPAHLHIQCFVYPSGMSSAADMAVPCHRRKLHHGSEWSLLIVCESFRVLNLQCPAHMTSNGT